MPSQVIQVLKGRYKGWQRALDQTTNGSLPTERTVPSSTRI